MTHERIVTSEAALADFIAFLRTKGTPMPAKPNEHFRARWSGGNATIVAAKGKANANAKAEHQGWQFSSAAVAAWKQFQAAQPKLKVTVKVGPRRASRFKSIALRDGAVCFYCERPLTPAAATIEHLLAEAHNGPSNLRNLALACEPCNKEARDLRSCRRCASAKPNAARHRKILKRAMNAASVRVECPTVKKEFERLVNPVVLGAYRTPD